VKNFLLALLAFILGFGAVVGYHYLRSSQQQTAPIVIPTTTNQVTPEPTFALVPPSEAVSGMLTVTSGHAEKLSRNETDYKEASTGAQILIGESVATKDNSIATATVSGIVSATLQSNAELVFANLFPEDFVLQQTTGKIEYLVSAPISVRALHSLVTINAGLPAQAGDIIINIIDTDMSITVKTGSVTFALVDTNNTTNVWNLNAGERANIDDANRYVYLVQPR
jgi:hypothetical protein